jgi:hypothetical protein
MIDKKLKILKSGTWYEIELYDGEGLVYNSVINRMANTTERSLSHSNTFEVPLTKQNIDALDINIFNSSQLAVSLNEKYSAKYFIDGELSQEGYVVINNMDSGKPNLNFIDEALSLTEKWGSTTYKEFIKDDTILLNVSSEYVDAIDEMKAYDMTKTTVVTVLSDISGQTYPIAYFPNNINAIGDKFQTDSTQTRLDKEFNPFQSRPLFNAQAFLDMVTEAYGYTLIKNTSVDWDKMATTIIAADELDQGEVDDGDTTTVHDFVYTVVAHYVGEEDFAQLYNSQVGFVFPESIGIAPDSLDGFPTEAYLIHGMAANASTSNIETWAGLRRFMTLDVSGDYSGTVTIKAMYQVSSIPRTYTLGVCYYDPDIDDYGFTDVIVDSDDSDVTNINITFSKDQFETPVVSLGYTLIGIYFLTETNTIWDSGQGLLNMQATEEALSPDVITFDDWGQYEQNTVIDITYSTPTKTIKEIVNGILQAFGALIEINHKDSQVEIFTYDYYITQRTDGNFTNWSDFLLEYANPNFNTNYGNEYGIKNKIGLGSPFLGNTVEKYIGNQNSNSKYKEFATNYNTIFSDIIRLVVVTASDSSYVYDEYSIGGASLLTFDELSSISFTQTNYEQDSQPGTLTGIPFIKFFDMSVITEGLDIWYNLLDDAVRARPSFLIPQDEMLSLDLKKPIFIGKLGGFYIVEEVIGYVDQATPVQVSLIKLPSEFTVDNGDNTAPIESIIAFYKPNEWPLTVPPNTNTNYFWWSSTDFNNYVPTSATFHVVQYTDSIDNGGTATGISYSFDLDVSTTVDVIGTVDFGDVLDSTETGWFQAYVEDQSGTQSDIFELEVTV